MATRDFVAFKGKIALSFPPQYELRRRQMNQPLSKAWRMNANQASRGIGVRLKRDMRDVYRVLIVVTHPNGLPELHGE